MFPESTIRECFVKDDEDKKIFQVVTGDRIELHSFHNGVKSLDNKLSFHLNRLQVWIDEKAATHRKLAQKVKMTLVADMLKIAPIIIAVILSAFASLKLLFINDDKKNFPQSKSWFTTHITISVLSLLFLLVVGLLPQVRLWLFSWDRNIKRYFKNNSQQFTSKIR